MGINKLLASECYVRRKKRIHLWLKSLAVRIFICNLRSI